MSARRRPELSRRSVLRLLGAAGVGAGGAGLLSGCGAPKRPPVRSGAVELGFWTHDPGYVTTFTDAIGDPDVMAGSPYSPELAVVSAAGDDLVSRLFAQAIADGNTPDLIGVLIGQFPRLMGPRIADNLLVDLTETVARHRDTLARLDPYRIDGRPYALESDTSASVLYYRKDLFDEHGIPDDVETWEELAEIGAEHYKATGQSLGLVATANNRYIYEQFLQLLTQRGGLPFDEEGRLRIDSEEAHEVLRFMVDGVRSGFLTALPDPYGGAVAAALKSGDLIAAAMPSWYNVYGLQANVPDQAGSWRMRNLPRFANGGHISSTVGGTGFAVIKDKPGTQAALDLLSRVYLTREGQIIRYEAGGFLPTLTDLYEDPYFTGIEDEFLGGQRVFDVYRPAVDDLPVFYQSESTQILVDVAGGPLLDALRGRSTPAQALREIASAYRQQVKR